MHIQVEQRSGGARSTKITNLPSETQE